MHTVTEQERILAHAIIEIRILLAGYLDSTTKDHMSVRAASFLAYALHNRALEALSGQPFDTGLAMAEIARVDELLNTNLVASFAQSGISARA